MSWDVSLVCDTCQGTVFDSNYTWNIGPMLHAVGCNPRDWNQRKGLSVAAMLADALALLEADPEKFRAMNPENEWGSYDSMLEEWLWPLHTACRKWPHATVWVV